MKHILLFAILLTLVGMTGAAVIDPAKQIDWDKVIDHDIILYGNALLNVSNITGLESDVGILQTDAGANETRIISLEGNDTAHDVDIAANSSRIDDVIIDVGANDTRVSTLEGYVQHMNTISGGTPGNFTLTGAAAGDALAGVAYFNNTTGNFTQMTDLSAEFNIPDTNILNQTYGGTSSLNGYLLVSWVDKTA